MAQVTNPIDWAAFENAVHAWFSEQTGLTVIWGNQDSPRPDYPFGTVTVIAGPTPVAPQDELRVSENPTWVLNNQLYGLRTITVSCQVFTASIVPTQHARHYISIAQASLSAPSVLQAFRDKEISVLSSQAIAVPDFVDEDTWIARATMDVRFYVVFGASDEAGTFIQFAEVSTQGLEPDWNDVIIP